MPEPLPKFDRPPVVETVLSAQFARLPKFRTAHAGCFWKSNLREDWKTVEEALRLPDQFERFGDERKWGLMGALQLSTAQEPQRTQFIRFDGSRMIQVQDSRLAYNWKRGQDLPYPSYDATRPEFDDIYKRFGDFVHVFDLGGIEENQWEVTYVNHIVRGELWESPGDWKAIFPWLSFPQDQLDPDTVNGRWVSVLPDNIGRLHTTLNFGRTAMDGPEALILELTARGAVSKDVPLTDGLDIGHAAIVRSFTRMTSKKMHEYWHRTA